MGRQKYLISSCCFAYVPKLQKVWATARGLRALAFGANLVDSAHDSAGYTRRLEKYDGWRQIMYATTLRRVRGLLSRERFRFLLQELRGFKIAVPGDRFGIYGACTDGREENAHPEVSSQPSSRAKYSGSTFSSTGTTFSCVRGAWRAPRGRSACRS